MAAGGAQGLNWSDKTYMIREVIQKFTLPVLVKVEEGIYGCRESESFSQDDLLKLDIVKSIPKVITCCVDHLGRNTYSGTVREDEHGYVERSDDLTIPVRYKGVVNIFHPEVGTKVYRSVGDMVKTFPRYVKTRGSFVSKNSVSVEGETVLELDRILPGEGLVCNVVDPSDGDNSDMRHISLDITDKHSFSLMADNTDYTLEQVINRFPLPQYVTFIKKSGPRLLTTNIQEIVEHSRIFEGTVKLKSMIELDVVIGHYKPPEGASSITQNRCKRTMVIIPVDSPTAREIDVRVPINTDDDNDYELVMARNFSQKNISEEDIDGTIYMDFLKTPKATFVDYEEIDDPPPRPPRPPRTSTGLDEPPPRPTKPRGTPKHKTAVETEDPQNKPPKRPPKRIPSVAEYDKPRTVETEDPQNKPPKRPPKRIPSVAEYDKPRTGGTPSQLKPSLISPRVPLPPDPIETDSDEDNDDYEEIDEIGLTDDDKQHSCSKVQRKESHLGKVPETFKFSLRKVHAELIKFVRKKRNVSDSSEPHDHSLSPPNIGPSDTSKPIPHQTPDQNLSKSDSRKWFESLKPNDLYQYLTDIKLDKMAIVCRDEKLNGMFFNSITDAQLLTDFRLSSIQMMKFRRFQNDGWLPNREFY